MKVNNDNSIRITIEFEGQGLKNFNAVKDYYGIKLNTEVIRFAITESLRNISMKKSMFGMVEEDNNNNNDDGSIVAINN